MSIFLLLISLIGSTQAEGSCVSNADCSGHGSCTKSYCVCGYNWMGEDCNTPLASLTTTSFYAFFKWGGFVWYLGLTLLFTYLVQHVWRRKSLKWLCFALKKKGGKEYDTQQMTLLLLFVHCLSCTIQYATDPLSLQDHRPVPTFFQWMLWYVDYLALMASGYTMIRLWVKASAALNQIALRALFWFDRLSIGLLLITLALCFVRTVTFVVSNGEGGLETFSAYISIASLLTGILYAFVVVGFALRYGIMLLRHLRHNSVTERKGGRSVRKLTLFLLSMMACIVLNIATQCIQKVIGTTEQQLVYAIVGRCCLAIFIVVVPIAIGTVGPDRGSHVSLSNPMKGSSRNASSKRHLRGESSRTEKSGTGATANSGTSATASATASANGGGSATANSSRVDVAAAIPTRDSSTITHRDTIQSGKKSANPPTIAESEELDGNDNNDNNNSGGGPRRSHSPADSSQFSAATTIVVSSDDFSSGSGSGLGIGIGLGLLSTSGSPSPPLTSNLDGSLNSNMPIILLSESAN